MASTGAKPAAVEPVTKIRAPAFGWRTLHWRNYDPYTKLSDEQKVVNAFYEEGARGHVTAGRNQSHDICVSLGIKEIPLGLYEVKRLSLRPGGKSVDPRFKLGRRGETVYGRRDAEIKGFAADLEDFLDQCLWSVEAIVATHEFIDQALQRRHGKKFNERLLRLAQRGLSIPELMWSAKRVIQGSVKPGDIQAGLAGLSGIFIIADHIYTLVKPDEYSEFIGFDSGSAEGPKLRYSGVVPLEPIDDTK